MSTERADIVIIGAGLIGLSSAYHIKNHNPDLDVLLIEKEKTHSQGNTGRSTAGFRDMFSTRVNFTLSHSSIEFYRHVQKDLGHNIGMKYIGYMFLMSRRKVETLEALANLSKLTKIDIIDHDRLAEISQLNLKLDETESRVLGLDPIEVGVLGRNCGILEIELLSSFYYEQCVKLGVRFKFQCEVKSLEVSPQEPLEYPGEPFLWQKKRIKSIITGSTEIKADWFIITTGAWTKQLLDPLGIDSHMRPKRREVFQTSSDDIRNFVHSSYEFLNDESVFPFTVLPSHGIYLRPYPKNGSFWVSTSGTTSDQEVGPHFSYDPNDRIEYTTPSGALFENHIAPVLKAYLKPYSNFKVSGSWTGYYSLNTQDKTPYIFPALNAIIATGGSGAGVMKADALGRIVSGILTGEEAVSLYDGSTIETDILGVSNRNVGIEGLRF